jgi:predicted transposase/invertase (TIGR01784 family)
MAGRIPVQGLSPTEDLLFKKWTTSEEHPEVTAGFIADMLDIEVAGVRVADPYDIRKYRASIETGGGEVLRHTEVDVMVTLPDGSRVIVEMQRARLSYALERSLYQYSSRYIANYAAAGRDGRGKNRLYSSLVPVHLIGILEESMYNGDTDARRRFELFDREHGRSLCQGAKGYAADARLISLTFLELAKNAAPGQANVAHWLDFLNGRAVSGEAPDYIRTAASMVAFENLDREEREMISLEERRAADLYAREHYVFHEGRNEGRNEALVATARAMLAEGADMEFVKRVTGLDDDVIEGLRKDY